MRALITIIMVCSLIILGTDANTQEVMKSCAGVEVQSVQRSAVFPHVTAFFDADPEKIEITSRHTPEIPLDVVPKEMTVITYGPVLGSMDSPEVETILSCTSNGFSVTAIIERSEHFNGSALKNVLWRPKIEISMIIRQPKVIFEAIWRMRLSNGTEIYRSQTPGQPSQKYPITARATLS